ncbi:hypothetical protein [Williamsia sp.]|uniref:hypothetical protein n=1 Tax=Williamsia sp. TaxID=1872085 RepID=UPI002F9505B8
MAAYELLADHWDEPNGESDTGYVRHLRGEVFDVPDKHLDRLLRIGALAPADEDATESDDAEAVVEDPTEPDDADDDSDNHGDSEANSDAAEQESDPDREPAPVNDTDRESDSDAVEQESDPDVEPAPGIERPKQTAGKPVWVDYAVDRGMTRDDAEALDKRDLIAALS